MRLHTGFDSSCTPKGFHLLLERGDKKAMLQIIYYQTQNIDFYFGHSLFKSRKVDFLVDFRELKWIRNLGREYSCRQGLFDALLSSLNDSFFVGYSDVAFCIFILYKLNNLQELVRIIRRECAYLYTEIIISTKWRGVVQRWNIRFSFHNQIV